MRQTIIVSILTAAFTALITTWGTTLIMASSSKKMSAVADSLTIDVMAITRAARDLPVQSFEAF